MRARPPTQRMGTRSEKVFEDVGVGGIDHRAQVSPLPGGLIV